MTGLAAGAVGLGAMAGAAVSKTAAASGSYKGKTSNGLQVSFKIKSGKVHNFSATVHALCISVLSPGTSHLDPVFHYITPSPMKLGANRKFAASYKGPSSTRASVDGKVNGKSASGHYKISYSKTGGVTSLGTLIIYACQEKGTWKTTLR